MPVPALHNGHLPMGRWVCTPGEVEAVFAPGSSPQRREIWEQWLQLSDALRQAVGEVAACWVAGSYVTDKTVPNDIDCVWVIDSQLWSAALNSGDSTLSAFLLAAARSGVKLAYGLKVDSFVLEWMPTAGVGRDVSTEVYLGNRGYWDNLWVRMRDSDERMESVPRRGYLEVIIDGYR